MRTTNLLAAAATVAVLALGGAAQAATIDFENGFDGVHATGHPELSLYGATDSLSVADYGDQGDGMSLAVNGDDNGNYLIGVFNEGTHTTLSLAFGNDDAQYSNDGDLAFLRLFLGATQVGEVSMLLNRDDVMNQTISYSGAAFNKFTFAFTNAAGLPFTGGNGTNTGLIEIVDNITYDAPSGGGAVPEPATWALMIGGFGLAGASLRRRKTATA